MEQEKLNSKPCAQCGKMMYSQGHIVRQICEDCKKKNRQDFINSLKKYTNNNKYDSCSEPQPLNEVIYEIEDYNKKHNTCLTYGQYVSSVDNLKNI